jgi:hypothetical protein
MISAESLLKKITPDGWGIAKKILARLYRQNGFNTAFHSICIGRKYASWERLDEGIIGTNGLTTGRFFNNIWPTFGQF